MAPELRTESKVDPADLTFERFKAALEGDSRYRARSSSMPRPRSLVRPSSATRERACPSSSSIPMGSRRSSKPPRQPMKLRDWLLPRGVTEQSFGCHACSASALLVPPVDSPI
jgi:hypothetical protein